ncbi:tyrosine-type recombinase/integrase [Legionella taurinensis]|uniref:Site-specific integrase n=1 Tax=Legionella taurinensis TaxID=70611 RepID=A0A3A5L592_9GAMM|nr:site-specific integrase [Legionella taurinensis]MDX1838197.1 site-specific integrase [Legionella taurinensis]RJT43327.1 site-specific integrase [Legionella taurinensis]RJT64138.1 site-specific integrase [Legionella taurinensis]STY26366.1 phage integrase [Legionella taurinensis]
MALYRRNEVWWISITHDGQRIQRSTGTANKLAAQEYHDKFKAELWSLAKLQSKAVYSWRDAVLRWLKENGHKRSINDDKTHLRWLDGYLKNYQLHEINRDLLESIADKKQETGVTATTVNRMLEVIRAILRKAQMEWEWLDKIPAIRMRHVENKRIRWITVSQAARLLKELPSHLRDMAAFSLATGLRAANVKGLQWQEVDMQKRHAWVHPDEAKTKKAIPVPLNDNAIAVLKSRIGSHPKYVFTYNDQPIQQCNTKAWRNALKRAGIENFRWHDLRHTWASWHVQNGTSLQELQLLGGWSSFEMVLRYAHLSSDHLKAAASTINTLGLVNG